MSDWRSFKEVDLQLRCMSSRHGVIECPAVAVVGHIPYLPWTEVPPAYKDIRIERAPGIPWRELTRLIGLGPKWAIRKMFEVTGNLRPPTPPHFLGGTSGYEAFLETKEFRAAIALAGVSVNLQRRPSVISGWARADCGYTPWQDGQKGLAGRSYFPGRSPPWKWTSDWRESEVELRLRSHFVLGHRMDFEQSVPMRGHWAPYAWIDVRYTVPYDPHLKPRLRLRGSAFPSVELYHGERHDVDWMPVGRRSMLDNTTDHIAGFLTAGRGKRRRVAPEADWLIDQVLP